MSFVLKSPPRTPSNTLRSATNNNNSNDNHNTDLEQPSTFPESPSSFLFVPCQSPKSCTRSKYANNFSPYHDFYENYFTSLSKFSFEKAKEYVTKQQRFFTVKHLLQNDGQGQGQGQGQGPGQVQEKPSSQVTITRASNWMILMTSLSHFVSAEKGYMKLSFLGPKGFLRKDNKTSLMMIKSDLKKLADPKLEEQIRLREDILGFVAIRLELMEFYGKLSFVGTTKNADIADVVEYIESIVEEWNETKTHCRQFTQTFCSSLGWEMESVKLLLKALWSMQNFQFLPSLVSLQEANRQMMEWANYLLPIHVQTSKLKPGETGQQSFPLLYNWIFKLKEVLVSKFSLYFYEILCRNSQDSFNIKLYSTKLKNDLYYRLLTFQKRSEALALCLVFDDQNVRFQPNGYEYPQTFTDASSVSSSSSQDMANFPSVLSIPSKPESHWPKVIIMINDSFQQLADDKFIAFYDSQLQTAYFILRMDFRMYLVAIFEADQSEKDNSVYKFMHDLAQELRSEQILASLKTGVKP